MPNIPGPSSLGFYESSSGNPEPIIGTGGAAHIIYVQRSTVSITDEDVNEALKPFAIFLTNGAEVLSIEMTVSENALDQFEILYQFAKGGTFIQRVTAALDFTTPNAPVLGASGSFLTAAVGLHWVTLDVKGVYSVQLKAASGNAAGSKITVNGAVL